MVNATVKKYFIRKLHEFNYIDIFCKDGSFDDVKRGSRSQIGKFDSSQCMVAISLSYIYNLGLGQVGLCASLQNLLARFDSGRALNAC